MAISNISNWLNGDRLFSVGVKLYLIHGKDAFFKKVLESGYSKTVYNKLVQELMKLEHQEAEPDEDTGTKKYSLPPDLLELRDNLNNMYSELRLIHAELPKQVNAITRRDMCLRILKDFKTIDAGYDIIKFYEATGKRPENTNAVQNHVYTLSRIIEGIKQIPVNLSKTRDKLKKETDPVRIKTLNEKIAAWEKEIETIKNIITEKADVVIHDASKSA